MLKHSHYLLIMSLLFACSKISDQQYFDKANEFLKVNKVEEAIKSFESLVSEFPDSKLAPKALSQLAILFQTHIDPKLTPEQSFEKAQKYFLQVYEKYPDSEEAPKSLFMSAFILANDLKKYDEATKAFNLFLEKYPSDPLAVSAKQELDNMGIPPEEILKRTDSAKK